MGSSPKNNKPHSDGDENTMPSITALLQRKKFTKKDAAPVEPTRVLEISPAEITAAIESRAVKQPLKVPPPPARAPGTLVKRPPAKEEEPAQNLSRSFLIEHVDSRSADDITGSSPSISAISEVPILDTGTVERWKFRSLEAPKSTKTQRKKITHWTTSTLHESSSIVGKAIKQLQDKITSAIFMSIEPVAPDKKLPHFLARATFTDPSKVRHWEGLHWHFENADWNRFVTEGTVSYPQLNLDWLVEAFHADFTQHALYFVRVGTQNACRGCLALVAKKSFTPEDLVAVKKILDSAAA